MAEQNGQSNLPITQPLKTVSHRDPRLGESLEQWIKRMDDEIAELKDQLAFSLEESAKLQDKLAEKEAEVDRLKAQVIGRNWVLWVGAFLFLLFSLLCVLHLVYVHRPLVVRLDIASNERSRLRVVVEGQNQAVQEKDALIESLRGSNANLSRACLQPPQINTSSATKRQRDGKKRKRGYVPRTTSE